MKLSYGTNKASSFNKLLLYVLIPTHPDEDESKGLDGFVWSSKLKKSFTNGIKRRVRKQLLKAILMNCLKT